MDTTTDTIADGRTDVLSGSQAEPDDVEHDVEQLSPSIRRAGPAPERKNAVERELIRRAADDAESLSRGEQLDAAEFLLRAFRGEEDEVVDELELNVGTRQHPRWIKWTIRSVPGPEIRKIRDAATDRASRAARRGGAQAVLSDSDAGFLSAVRIVVRGTASPNIAALANGEGIDPGKFLELTLEAKHGLIEQLSEEILSLSGYDRDDIRDAREVAAAGNS